MYYILLSVVVPSAERRDGRDNLQEDWLESERSSFGSVGVLGNTTTPLLCPCRRCRRLSRLFFPLISRVTARRGGVPRGRARGPRWAGGREGRARSRRRTRDDDATSSRNNIINTPYLLAVPTRAGGGGGRAGGLIWK